MTWIGKILSVFVLIAGVAAIWFMVTLHVASTNLRNDRAAWKKLYEDEEAARKSEQDTYRTEKDALERQLAGELSKSKGLADQVTKLTGSNDLVAQENIRLTRVIKDSDVKAVDLEANLRAVTEEADKLRDRGKKMEIDRQNLAIDRETALKEKTTAENKSKKAESDLVLAKDKIENLTTQLTELRAAGGNPNALVLNSFAKPPAPLPDGIRGTVTEYKDGYVSMSVGIDAGLTVGAVVDVFRYDGGGIYLGSIVIQRVYPKEAVGTFKPADARRTIAKLRAEELPKIGDTVGKLGISGPLGIRR